MTTPSYDGQPKPFDPVGPETQVARPAARPKRNLVPIVAAVVLAAVAFAGGFAVANATATKTTTAAVGANGNDNGGGQGFGPNASGRPRNGGGFGAGGFGGGAAGTVGTVSSDQMTISTAAGGSRLVLLTPTTEVTEVTSANKTISDITSGKTVTVVGTSNPDGSVTATRVVIGDVAVLGRGFGGGADGSPAPSAAP